MFDPNYMKKQQEQQRRLFEYLRQVLMNKLRSNEVITIQKSFKVTTDRLIKSDTAGKYAGSQSIVVPKGSNLMYKSYNSTFRQVVLEDEKENEYEFYIDPLIQNPDTRRAEQNTALFGLLENLYLNIQGEMDYNRK